MGGARQAITETQRLALFTNAIKNWNHATFLFIYIFLLFWINWIFALHIQDLVQDHSKEKKHRGFMRWRTNWVNPSFQCQWLFKEGQWKILTRKEQKNWKPGIQNIIEETETYRLLFSVEGLKSTTLEVKSTIHLRNCRWLLNIGWVVPQ